MSSDDVRGRLIQARRSRGQVPLDDKKIRFWEKRKELDLSVIPALSVESHMINIADDNWDSAASDIIAWIVP